MSEPLLSQGVHLRWRADGTVISATGACAAVLGQPASAVVGVPLAAALRVSPERASAIANRAGAGGGGGVEFVVRDTRPEDHAGQGGRPDFEPPRTYLRLDLGQDGDQGWAFVLDLTALLKGAPPLQISKLSSSLSHEIRNPLSSVKMAVQTLARNPGHSDRDQRRLTIAQREIRTMERMLWLLSEYGRDSPPRLEELPLRRVLQLAVEMVEPELRERNVAVQVDEPGAAHGVLKVRTDPGRLRPVLAQLLLNIAMGLEPEAPLRVHLARSERGATLRIQDPSSALLAAESATLFEPFGSRLARGAGLSLAALKQVMVRQGGTLLAEGGEDGGTVFSLHFPLAPEPSSGR